MRELTLDTLQFFSTVSWATPDEFMVAVGCYPRPCAYSWLRRLHRRGLLRRSLNFQGRIQYQLGKWGATKLLYLKRRKMYNVGHENQTRQPND